MLTHSGQNLHSFYSGSELYCGFSATVIVSNATFIGFNNKLLIFGILPINEFQYFFALIKNIFFVELLLSGFFIEAPG